MDETLKELAEHIELGLSESLLSWSIAYGELTLTAGAGDIIDVVRYLRDNSSCKFVNRPISAVSITPGAKNASTLSTTSCRPCRTSASA
jgi:glycerol dehydrogenase-like iron-containing ADH family enzyme